MAHHLRDMCRFSFKSRLRSWTACHCDISHVPSTGSLNMGICVSFEDGVKWTLRSPRNGNGASHVLKQIPDSSRAKQSHWNVPRLTSQPDRHV
jgi:hypothetical protein